MPTVRYTTVNGEVLAEKRGGVRRFYVPDPFGSTVALLDSSQNQTDTFTYWPYGEEKSRTGTTATPFRFVGTLGYYRDGASRTYVRARHLRTDQGRCSRKTAPILQLLPANANGGGSTTRAQPIKSFSVQPLCLGVSVVQLPLTYG
jgi:hypothetical protein